MFLSNIKKPLYIASKTVGTRECEIKYALHNATEKDRFKDYLEKHGFVAEEVRLETDYIPDTPDFLCRKNNLLLRFRNIKKLKNNDILITLKIGKTNIQGFQDAYEIQYYFSDINKELFDKINERLRSATGISLPIQVHKYKSIEALRNYLFDIGFPSLRTYIEKKRTEYSKRDIHVTFDLFPEKIGNYLEIETQTPEELKRMIEVLKLNPNRLELRDYGDIVKAKKEGLPEEEKRTAVFKEKHFPAV